MKSSILNLATLIIIISFSISQERIDVIYLKNGDVIKGLILENIFNDYVRIELFGGSVLSFKYVDIERVSKETTETKEPVRQPQTQSLHISDAHKTQFSQGTISAGSLFSYSSYNPGDAYGYTRNTIIIGTPSTSMLAIKPTVSCFITPNLSIDGIIGFTTITIDYEESEDYEQSEILLGIGATFYEGTLYGGGGIVKASSESDNSDIFSSNYFEVHGGYLHGLSENVFLDVGVSYLSGMGEYEVDGDDTGVDNEETALQFNVGIKAFFNL